MTTYQKVVRLLGRDFAAILELCKKLFITWSLDSKNFFYTINHLKKDQIIGLMDDSYEVVKKVKKEITDVGTVLNNILTVKPNLTLAKRITNGNYDWKNDSINESNFSHDPITIGEWEFRLIHPNKSISSEDAVIECEKPDEKGLWEAGKLEHLLAFGEAFPEEQKKFPIVALGSVCRLGGRRHVPGLWCGGGGRRLPLDIWNGDWNSDYRFLSVRKIYVS